MTYTESVTLLDEIYNEIQLAIKNNRKDQFECMLDCYSEIIDNILLEFDMTFNEFALKYNNIKE